MSKKQELKAVSYVLIGEQLIPWEELDNASRLDLTNKMMKNTGNAVSDYLKAHPEEIGGITA